MTIQMTKEQFQIELNNLITTLGTAALNRMLFLNSEIQRLTKQEAAECAKQNPPTPQAPDVRQ